MAPDIQARFESMLQETTVKGRLMCSKTREEPNFGILLDCLPHESCYSAISVSDAIHMGLYKIQRK